MITSLGRFQSINQRTSFLSLLAFFGLLTGITDIAAAPGSISDDSVRSSAQGTPSTTSGCVSYGLVPMTVDELSEMSIFDWPVRHYTPVAVADPSIGQQAVELNENWLRCAQVGSSQDASNLLAPTDVFMGYLTDRMQYVMYLQNFPERAPEELAVASEFRQDHVMESGTLPLNRPLITASVPLTGLVPSFRPGDVYTLTDGRYGAVIGSISTSQLHAYINFEPVSPSSPLAEGEWLIWIAFVDVDGQLFIDEYVPFCVAPPLETNGTPQVASNYPHSGVSQDTVGNCQSILNE